MTMWRPKTVRDWQLRRINRVVTCSGHASRQGLYVSREVSQCNGRMLRQVQSRWVFCDTAFVYEVIDLLRTAQQERRACHAVSYRRCEILPPME